MSYIDYASRSRSRVQAHDDEDVESGAHGGYGGGAGAAPADPFADNYGQSHSQPAAQQQYDAAPAQQPHAYAAGGRGRGHDFQIEHMQTDGEDLGGYAPYSGEGGLPGRTANRAEADAQVDQEPFFDPTFEDYTHEAPLEMPFFDHVVQDYGHFGTFQKLRLNVRQGISFLLTLGALGLVAVAAFAHYFNPFAKSPPRARADREYERRVTGERLSGRVQYYAEYWGYRCDEHEIVTEGGWILKAHRISDPRRPGGAGYPVILQHGILCNSSHFVMNEERSLAFWLVDQGYDVWLTNIRAGFGAGHTEFSRADPRFWAFGLKELAFDLRDVIEFICEATAHPRVAYVGHSQGSGSMYLALSPGICPELGDRLSVFIALGPSVYAGPVLRRFPFSLIRRFRSRKWWGLVFGVREFIPAIGLFQRVLPSFIFGHLAAVLFMYMFGFHLRLTPKRQFPKMFRSLPVPTSSELLYWYMAAWAARGCIFDPRITEPWFPRSFPPHSMFYGTIDLLVLGKPLAQRLQRNERNVEMIHCVELEGYEHLDYLMAHDCVKTTFPGIKESIDSTIDPEDLAPAMREVSARASGAGAYGDDYNDDAYGGYADEPRTSGRRSRRGL